MSPLDTLTAFLPRDAASREGQCQDVECQAGGECRDCQEAREAESALNVIRALVEAAIAYQNDVEVVGFASRSLTARHHRQSLRNATIAFCDWTPNGGTP